MQPACHGDAVKLALLRRNPDGQPHRLRLKRGSMTTARLIIRFCPSDHKPTHFKCRPCTTWLSVLNSVFNAARPSPSQTTTCRMADTKSRGGIRGPEGDRIAAGLFQQDLKPPLSEVLVLPGRAGDFNYDGARNSLDFNAIATNFGPTRSSPSPGTQVPEPSSGFLLGLLLANRHRRR